jgi:hypothetical protein
MKRCHYNVKIVVANAASAPEHKPDLGIYRNGYVHFVDGGWIRIAPPKITYASLI